MSVRLSSCLLTFLLTPPAPLAAQNALTVAAAADLSALEPDLADAYRKIEPSVSLRFVTGASAMLAQHIENGAPYDVFLSANAQYVERLVTDGKLRPDSVRVYTEGRLGLLWRDGKQRAISDLASGWVRSVAMPNPQLAPYGVAAQQALEQAGIWRQVQPKVIYGENVRQTLQLFESGNTDAVITSSSLLGGKSGQAIPATWHKPIRQKAGIVAETGKLESAQKFLAFLTGPQGQAVFAKYGFGIPPG